MKRVITITNNGVASLAQYRTIRLVLDHASLVASRRSRADARDIFVRIGSVSLPVHVRFPNTAATEVFFSLQAAIASGGSAEYVLHIGALDRDEDRHPVPMGSKSQWDLEAASPGYRSSGRVQPFALYDGFRDNLVGGKLEPIAGLPGSPSTAIYESSSVAGWLHAAPGLVAAPSGSGGLRLTWKDFSAPAAVRVRGTMILQSGYTAPALGLICKAPGGALTGYVGGVAVTPSTGFVGRINSGVLGSTLSAALNRSVDNLTIAAEVAYTGASNFASAAVDGVAISALPEAAFAANERCGIWTNTTGAAGGAAFLEAWAEVWDGVPESSIAVTVASLAPVLPCPGLPGMRETLQQPSTSSERVVITEAVGPQLLPVYELAWPVMDPDDWWELQALWYAQRGGAGVFSWTPPKSVQAERYRFVPGSLELQQIRAGHYAARVSVERVVQ